jgi:hypothetical protein
VRYNKVNYFWRFLNMKFRKLQWLVVYTMLAIILSSCNLGATPAPTQDVGAIQTAAFNQVLTQVALASSPTPLPTNTALPATPTLQAPPTFAPVGGGTVTPFPFNTPLPGLGLTPFASPVPTLGGVVPTITTKNGCNDGIITGESAPYDGAMLNPNESYKKSFTFLNTGSCAWDEGYTFVFQPAYSSPGFSGYNILFRKTSDFIAPGKSITFTLELKASNLAGEHIGTWKLRDDGGNYFGSMVWVKYVVGTKAERESLTATAEAGN